MSSQSPGSVTFEVPSGTYRITVVRQGFNSATRENIVITSDYSTEVLLTPIPTARYTLQVRVVNYKERPISGATVRILRSDNRQEVTRGTTGTEGTVSFTLDQGSYIIEASKSGYRQPAERSVILDRDKTEQLTLQGYRFTITVRNANTGQPISGATVKVFDQSTGNQVDEGTTV